MKYRISGNIKNTEVYQAIQDILFESPELVKNEWLSHRAELVEIIENENARAPPLASLFEEENVSNPIPQKSLIGLLLDEISEKARREENE